MIIDDVRFTSRDDVCVVGRRTGLVHWRLASKRHARVDQNSNDAVQRVHVV